MLTQIGYRDKRSKVGNIVLDVLVTEQVDFDAEVTRYPVENGADMTDHITLAVKRLRIGGTIAVPDMVGLLSDGNAERGVQMVDVVEALEGMMNARDLVDVSTGRMQYPQFAIESGSITRTAGSPDGNWVTIEMGLTQIRKVSLETADVPQEPTVQEPAQGRAGETNKQAKANETSKRAKPAEPKPQADRPVDRPSAGEGDFSGLQRLNAVTGNKANVPSGVFLR